MGDTTKLFFSCGCKQVTGSVRVPNSILPLQLSYCHCGTCRHQSGLLAASYANLPKDHEAFTVEGPVTGYASSKNLTRYFCTNCGANIYVDASESGEKDICTGVLHHDIELKNHIFLDDTKDGGMSLWLSHLPGWSGFSEQSKRVDCSIPPPPQLEIGSKAMTVDCHCACRSIQFLVSRPNEKSKLPHRHFPDLMIPHATGNPNNESDEKWWLRSHDAKYLAGTCMCTSCRVNSGFDVSMWAFIPKVNILDTSGRPLDLNSVSSLKQYRSSQDVCREFCGKCGASVFWRCESRPDLVDVCAGLLSANEGTRAESWLEWWTERVSFEEDAPNKTLALCLRNGIANWAKARKDPTSPLPASQ